MDRLTSMAVFVRTVELGSFAAAAEALQLSAPMVGKHVRFLEDRLGARLINRTTRRHSPTEFGRAYYERCRLVLAEAEAADALVTGQLAEPRGRLRVTMPALLGRHCVAPILLRLAERHPALDLDLSFNDRVIDLAEDGYDLAIRTGDPEDRAGLTMRRLARHPMLVCAAPAYLERHGRPGRIEDLAAHRAILYCRPGWALPWLFPGGGLAGGLGDKARPPVEITPPARLRLDDLEAIADAAAAGMGLAWLPSWLIRDRLASGALETVLPAEPPHMFDDHALWPRTPHLPLKTRLAIDALAAELPGLVAAELPGLVASPA